MHCALKCRTHIHWPAGAAACWHGCRLCKRWQEVVQRSLQPALVPTCSKPRNLQIDRFTPSRKRRPPCRGQQQENRVCRRGPWLRDCSQHENSMPCTPAVLPPAAFATSSGMRQPGQPAHLVGADGRGKLRRQQKETVVRTSQTVVAVRKGACMHQHGACASCRCSTAGNGVPAHGSRGSRAWHRCRPAKARGT